MRSFRRAPFVQAVGGIILGSLLAGEAVACSRSGVYGEPFALDTDWRTEFTRRFDDSEAVYLVRVRSAGLHTPPLERAACDTEVQAFAILPPLLPPRNRRTQADVRDYRQSLREMPARQAELDKAREACQPEKARFIVERTLKGEPVAEWVETGTLIDVVPAAPAEPTKDWDGQTAYYRDVFRDFSGGCGVPPARRLSETARYVVFLQGDYSSPGGSAGWTRTGRSVDAAYLVDERTPFLAEAQRVSAMPHKAPWDPSRSAEAVVSDAQLQASADAAAQAVTATSVQPPHTRRARPSRLGPRR